MHGKGITALKHEQERRPGADASPEWQGRFPYNEIISLLDVNRSFNLAESTSQDLTVGELLDLAGVENIRDLKLGYGKSAGAVALREAVADACKVPVEQVITTQGTALGLFLLAFELCRPGDEAVLATPCFPPSRDCLLGVGANVREVKLSFENGYRLDLDGIGACLSAKTRLVSIASPQNPSGVQTTRADVEKLLDTMERRCPEAVLFIDETYREATYGDDPASRSATSAAPSSPSPHATVTISSGRPASTKAPTSFIAESGVRSDGLRITELPPAIAGPSLWATRLSGSLYGVIAAMIPSGSRLKKPLLFSDPS